MGTYLLILSAFIALSTAAILDMTDVSGSICIDKRNGDVVSHPLDCQAYFICGNVPTIRYCDEGLHFDPLRKVCNWPDQVKCDLLSLGSSEASEHQENQESQDTLAPFSGDSEVSLRSHPIFIAIDIETGRPVDPMDKYDPKLIECRHYGAYFLPHPHSCRRYFICAYGHLHKHKCGYGTAWNYKRGECELDTEMATECYSRNVIGMDIDAGHMYIADENNEQFEQLKTHSYETTTTSMPSTVCFVIDTTLEFTTGTTGSTFHPTGTYHTATAASTAASAMATPTPSTGRIDGLSENQKCPKNGEAYLPNIDDCSKYFICIAGRPVPTKCPHGLYWDQNAEFCDMAKNVNCYQESKK